MKFSKCRGLSCFKCLYLVALQNGWMRNARRNLKKFWRHQHICNCISLNHRSHAIDQVVLFLLGTGIAIAEPKLAFSVQYFERKTCIFFTSGAGQVLLRLFFFWGWLFAFSPNHPNQLNCWNSFSLIVIYTSLNENFTAWLMFCKVKFYCLVEVLQSRV